MPTESLPRARSSPALRVHVPGNFTVRGRPAVTDGLDGELARLHDQGTGGMAPLAAPLPASPGHTVGIRAGLHWVRCEPGLTSEPTEWPIPRLTVRGRPESITLDLQELARPSWAASQHPK